MKLSPATGLENMMPYDGNAMFLSQMTAISFLCNTVVIMMGFSTCGKN